MKLLPLAALLLSPVLLTACAQETIVATAEPMCAAITHVCISRADQLTEGTSQQILGNNLARKRLCPAAGDPCAAVRSAPAPAPKSSPPKPTEPKLSSLGWDDRVPWPVARWPPEPADGEDIDDDGVPPPARQAPQIDADKVKRVAGLYP